MKSFGEQISAVSKSEYSTAAVYALGAGLLLSDIIPTVADATYFAVEKKLRDRWKKGEISPEEYWGKESFYYYALNPLWWFLVLGITVATKGDAKRKLTVMSGLIGGGAVVGVIWKNIHQDKLEMQQALEDKEKLEKESKK